MEKRIKFNWNAGRTTHLWPDYPLVMAGSEILTIVIEDIEQGVNVDLIVSKVATRFALPHQDVLQYVRNVSNAISSSREVVSELNRSLPKPFPEGGLSMATLNLTRECNLKCTHCYTGVTRFPKEMTATQLRTAIIQLAKLIKHDPKLLIISGGEPTLEPEKLKIAVVTARECGLNPRLNTNGQCLSETTATFLSANSVLTQVSLDGIDPETNALIRGSRGAFDKTVSAIKTLLAAGCRTRLSFTVHSQNVHQIPEILSLAEALGVEQVVTSNLVRIGNAVRSGLQSVEHKHEFRILYEAVRFSKKRQQMTRSTLLAETIAAIRAGIRFTYCGTGHSTCCVDADGAVYPCINMMREEFHSLNATDPDFASTFPSQDTWPELRALDVDTLNAECGRCVCRYFCGGFCRGETIACGRSLSAPYVRCHSWKRGLFQVFDILSETPDIYDFGQEALSAIMHRE